MTMIVLRMVPIIKLMIVIKGMYVVVVTLIIVTMVTTEQDHDHKRMTMIMIPMWIMACGGATELPIIPAASGSELGIQNPSGNRCRKKHGKTPMEISVNALTAASDQSRGEHEETEEIQHVQRCLPQGG